MLDHFFDFYGVTVGIRIFDESFSSVLKNLDEDFSFFSRTQVRSTTFEIEVRSTLELSELQKKQWSKKFPLFTTKMNTAFGLTKRVIKYDDNHWCDLSSPNRILIFGADEDLTYEIAYIALMSKVGECLEKKGWLRMHALGLETKQGATIIPLPCGGGKSVLAYQAIQQNIPIYSDEIILTNGEKIYPFPVRIALKKEAAEKLNVTNRRLFKRAHFDQKVLVPIPNELIAKPSSIYRIYSGHKGGKLSLIFILALGLGLPQMREFLIRSDNLLWLPILLLQRIKIAIALINNREIQNVEIDQSHLNNFDKLCAT